MKKLMPYGVSNFENVATQNYYYIDKTHYIEKLEKLKYPVFLRPRRFGKSLFTQTLKWYYDIKAKDRFEELFGNLYIGKNPTKNRNKYFVLTLNFSGMDIFVKDSEVLLKEKFDQHICIAFEGFISYYHKELGIEKKYQNEFRKIYHNNSTDGLNKILQLVSDTNHKLYICIDEYDSLTNALAIRYQHSTPDDNLYTQILKKGGFFRSFFEALKAGTDTAIDRVYITGILPITISDMKSGFNIAEWITFDPQFINMLGITNQEFDDFIDEVYKDYDIKLNKTDLKQTIKQYYDGYKFSSHSEKVYNPMMTLYFLNCVIRNKYYPPQLTDNNIRIDYNQISFLFGHNFKQRDKIIKQINEHKKVKFMSKLNISFDMTDFKEGKYITEGLYYSGILTYTDNPRVLTVPNIVTYDFAIEYFEKIKDFEFNKEDVSQWMFDYIEEGDVKGVIKGFFDDVILLFPGDFFANVNESFYHGLFFHVLFSTTEKNTHEVLPEYNLPQGKADLMVRSYPDAKVPCHLNDLFELKRVPKTASDAEFEQKHKEGIVQMKKYLCGQYADWRGIAVCFRGNKDFKIKIL